MKIAKKHPQEFLDKRLLRFRPLETDFLRFKSAFDVLLSKIDNDESEEHQKNYIRDFLLEGIYKPGFEINTKGRFDLAIHLGPSAFDRVGVLVEAKRPTNRSEMISVEKPNAKALQELVLYYLRERIDEKNDDLKYLIATNIEDWFIFRAQDFERVFHSDKKFLNEYDSWRNNRKVSSNTLHFYDEIARPYIETLDVTIECAHFNLNDYRGRISDRKFNALYKLLSPFFLLKERFGEDSNRLDKKFYTELLHIIGLEELKEKGKTLIKRKSVDTSGSLMDMAITMLDTKGVLSRINSPTSYGDTRVEKHENIALQLCITWINRILFLKLLEGQLIGYHNGDSAYRFLDQKIVHDFDELFVLFHEVLAKKPTDRTHDVRQKFALVPYLNSSLFEISDLENETITIESLRNTERLSVGKSSILRRLGEKAESLPTLEYLFRFLGCYDFASEGSDDIQSENRRLINASVLGKVFEKINGYKDGSIYTPGLITMYMCRQALRLAVVQKFRDETDFDGSDFDELENWVKSRNHLKENLARFNSIVDSLRICDPAVGSGHFLVSALNELLAIKSALGVLWDGTKPFWDHSIEIEADELLISDRENNLFEYRIHKGQPLTPEMQRLQSALFHEKQNLIENCLFGVDINPNSVRICRLRLWIELLKNAYYKSEGDLETLPNIDINIKQGNSLVSRFSVDSELDQVLNELSLSIDDYRALVDGYKVTRDREAKRDFDARLKTLKDQFRNQLSYFSPERRKLKDLRDRKTALQNRTFLFGEEDNEREKRFANIARLKREIEKQVAVVRSIEENEAYAGAFEWRFEFPEVLSDQGRFVGFDVVIGNPPYIESRSSVVDAKTKDLILKKIWKDRQALGQLITRGSDILIFFFEKGLSILNRSGYMSFITQNAWLDTEYGHKFQRFLVESTEVLGIYDSDKKYFEDSANVNTVITLFHGTVGNPLNPVTFATFPKGFEDAPYEVKEIQKSDLAKIRSIIQSDPIFEEIKWGVVLSSDDAILELHRRLKQKQAEAPKFEIGQGLNLTKDFILSEEFCLAHSLPSSILNPIFTSEDGAPFAISRTNKFILRGDIGVFPELEIGIPPINHESRRFPNLVLPRGLGRHFCAINEIDAYTGSFVEIYLEPENENLERDTLYLWAFLNSTVGYLIREISGRKNLGGGMLKAEAADLRRYPIYFDFENHFGQIKQLFAGMKSREAIDVLSEIRTPEHIKLDEIVFSTLGYESNDREGFVTRFSDLVRRRAEKSKT